MSKVLWHSTDSIFAVSAQAINLYDGFEALTATSLGANSSTGCAII